MRFAVEATRSEDAPADAAGDAARPAMDPDRRRFLEEALASMTVNVVQRLEAAAAILTAAESSESDQLEALECLADHVDNIDMANDFCKIGGLDVVLPLLRPPPPATTSTTTPQQQNSPARSLEVRRQCAALLAELAQNNPFCQEQLLKRDALAALVPLLADAATAAPAMRAISASVRAFEPAAEAFIAIGGLECTLACVRELGGSAGDGGEEAAKSAVPSLFMLRALCAEYPAVKGKRRDELVFVCRADKSSSVVELIVRTLKLQRSLSN